MGWLSASGRGARYSPARGLLEKVLQGLYAGGWAARAWGALPGRTELDSVAHTFPILPARCPPLRVAFASDLHFGPTTPPALLDKARDTLRAWAPDVLLLGGDYVFLEVTPRIAARLRAWVQAIGAPTTLAVLGNHDLWTHHGRIEQALAEAGATVLVNGAVRLSGAHRGVLIAGLDDPWTGRPDPVRALAAHQPGDTLVVLVHAPDAVPMLRAAAPSLVVCGHTHGGQIALPGGRMVVAPSPMSRTYPHGQRALPWGGQLVVSRGVGAVELPIRTWARPDVRLLTLTAVSGGCTPRTGRRYP